MAQLGGIPIRVVRCGAAVLLLAAGTLAAIVVSEWPGVTVAVAEKPIDADRPAVTPNANIQGRPQIVASNGAKAAFAPAANTASIAPAVPPHGVVEVSRVSGELDLAERQEWWSASPTGRMIDEVMAYDPTRTGATVRISPQLDVTAGITRFNTGHSTGTIENADGSPHSPGETQLYDFSVRFEALGSTPVHAPLEAGVIAGLRAADLFDQATGHSSVSDPLPVLGGDARWKWSERAMVRASELGEAPGSDRDYLDLRLEHAWRLGSGSDAWLSLGWRHLRGMLSNEQPQPTLRQDAILLELKIGF